MKRIKLERWLWKKRVEGRRWEERGENIGNIKRMPLRNPVAPQCTFGVILVARVMDRRGEKNNI